MNEENYALNQHQSKETAGEPSGYTFKENLINWTYMFPLALIIMLQIYFFGRTLGDHTTFPLFSISSYICLISSAAVLFMVNLFTRSMVYSVMAEVMFFVGVFSSWFGSIIGPVIRDTMNIIPIMQNAWESRNIPYELIITLSMSTIIALAAFYRFISSVAVKALSEMILGKSWGSGKTKGYIACAIFLAVVQIFFSGYRYFSADNSKYLLWNKRHLYKPYEAFLKPTGNQYALTDQHLIYTNGDKIYSVDLKTGKTLLEDQFFHVGFYTGFKDCKNPIFTGLTHLAGPDKEADHMDKKVSYPSIFPGLNLGKNNLTDKSKIDYKPLTSFDLKSGHILVYYNYGFAGLYSSADGKMLWLKQIDLPHKADQNNRDLYLPEGHVDEREDAIILACTNGIIQCLNKEDGSLIWKYEHRTPRFNGVTLKAKLIPLGDKVVAVFHNGDILTLDIQSGTQLYGFSSPRYISSQPAYVSDSGKITLMSDNGILYTVDLETGKELEAVNMLPTKNDFASVLFNGKERITVNGGRIMKAAPNAKDAKILLQQNKRSFSTEPRFKDKYLYIGTKDGYIYCVHSDTGNIEWKCRTDGALSDDALHIKDNLLLAKTDSGSVYCFNLNP